MPKLAGVTSRTTGPAGRGPGMSGGAGAISVRAIGPPPGGGPMGSVTRGGAETGGGTVAGLFIGIVVGPIIKVCAPGVEIGGGVWIGGPIWVGAVPGLNASAGGGVRL